MKRSWTLLVLALIPMLAGLLMLFIGLGMYVEGRVSSAASFIVIALLVLSAGVQMFRLRPSGALIMWMAAAAAFVAAIAAGQLRDHYMGIVFLGFLAGFYQKWLGQRSSKTIPIPPGEATSVSLKSDAALGSTTNKPAG